MFNFAISLLILLVICHPGHFQKPKLSEFYRRKSQNVGSKVKLFCSIEEGAKPFRFEWFQNGKPLLSGREAVHKIESDQDQSILTIKELRVEDSGNYSCTVHNKFGQDRQNTLVTVKGLQI